MTEGFHSLNNLEALFGTAISGDAIGERVLIYQSQPPGKRIGNATLMKIYFDIGDWSDSVIADSTIDDCEIVGTVMDGAEFNRVKFKNTLFYDIFSPYSLFSNCLFEECILRGCNFENAQFLDTIFSECRFISDNIGVENNFSNASFSGVYFDNHIVRKSDELVFRF